MGRKRKATTSAPETPSSTRRQSGRATKTRVTYEESHSSPSSVQDSDSEDEFKEEASKPQSEDDFEEPAQNEDSEAPEDEDEGQGSDDEYEKKLKKQGWKKKKGKDGKWEMVMDVPTAKDAGDTPYEEERIHPNTMEFLRDLKNNNRREWLKFHDAVFRFVLFPPFPILPK